MAAEDQATENQIKRLYAVLHSLGYDPKEWKKERNIASYAKLTRDECSDYITELEEEEAEAEFDKEVEKVPEAKVNAETKTKEEMSVAEHVALYADIWEAVLHNSTFAGLGDKEAGIAVAGIYREIMKDRRTVKIHDLTNGGDE
jgi:predicted secreted acid phosphatase